MNPTALSSRCLAITLLMTCATAQEAGRPGPRRDDAEALARACNSFAADLYRELGATGQPTCSPGSAAITLCMLLTGARGDTADEIATSLHLPAELRGERLLRAAAELIATATATTTGDDPPEPVLRLSNDLWVQRDYELVPAFVAELRSGFRTAPHALDFRGDPEAARQTINRHVAEATNQRIKDLVAPGMIESLTRVVLSNAVWFKDAWEHPFAERGTGPTPFRLKDGQSVDVPTMQIVENFAYVATDTWQLAVLPFAHGRLRMEIAVPRDGATLGQAEDALLHGSNQRDLAAQRLHVWLPRFRVAATHRLGDALQALGVRAAFDPAAADFSGIEPRRELFVSAVVQKAWIQVDEHGAEAAAATALVLKAGSAARPSEPIDFRCDRPFAFALRDCATGLLWFVGRVDDPRQ